MLQRFRRAFATDRHLRACYPLAAVRRDLAQASVREPLGLAILLAGLGPLLVALRAAQLAAQQAVLAVLVLQLLAIVQVGRSYFEYKVIKVVMNQI